jgi:Ca-activated chloride channel family protein
MNYLLYKITLIVLIVSFLSACNTEPVVKKIEEKASEKPIAITTNSETIEKLPKPVITQDKKKEDLAKIPQPLTIKENVDDHNETDAAIGTAEGISDSPQIGSGLIGNLGGGGETFGSRSGSARKYCLMKGGVGNLNDPQHQLADLNEPYDSTAQYKPNDENSFLNSTDKPLSTFSIDVDTASYTNSRRWLNNGKMPATGVIRTEEFINYFTYDYKAPTSDNEQPFSVYTEAATCPWNEKHQIIQIGLKGKELKSENRKTSNLVFLIDVSGSMTSSDKLPLLKSGMKMLVNHLDKEDKVAIVVYAGASGVALDPTSVKEKGKIINALESLNPGGSTNGSAGIHLAYQIAEQGFIKDGNNRIILATDGDFNVGTTSTEQLQTLIEEKRKSGVFLSVLGFGTGNINDHMMETLANKGNGNYNYIDRLSEAQKVLVSQLNATLYTIAKDVKIQIEFNPEHVVYYRLIGYENRLLAAEDFNNDKKDAGEIGAGHTVTALYEIVPVGVEINEAGKVDALKYQPVQKKVVATKTGSNEILTLKIRYKKPTEDVSTKQEYKMLKSEMGKPFQDAKNNLMWATATAAFAQKLNNSNFLNELSWEAIEKIAVKAKGTDDEGYRGEMIQLIKLSASLSKN